MTVSSENIPAPVRRPCLPDSLRLHGRRGLTIVELAVAVTIVGILAAISVPLSRKIIVTTKGDAVLNDLRVFSGSFQAYVHERGDWPAGSAAGVFPTGMDGYLRQSNWTRVTPIGGKYYWNPNSVQNGTRYRAVIVLATVSPNSVTTDTNQLLAIDRAIDDGNLATGNFQLGTSNYPIYILER